MYYIIYIFLKINKQIIINIANIPLYNDNSYFNVVRFKLLSYTCALVVNLVSALSNKLYKLIFN